MKKTANRIQYYIRFFQRRTSPFLRSAVHSLSFFICFFLAFSLILFSWGCQRKEPEPAQNFSFPKAQKGTSQTQDSELEDPNHEVQDSESAGIKPLQGVTAAELFRDVINIYNQAKVYSDDGYIEEINEINGAAVTERTPCRVTFRKPNFIRMEVARGVLTSDGEKMRGAILDPFYKDQILEIPAPFIFSSVKDLYPDVTLAHAMDLPIPQNIFWTPPQLIFLLAKEPLKTFAPSGEIEFLSPAYYRLTEDNGFETLTPCDRIAVTAEDGTRTFWISRQNKRVLRIDLPLERIQVPKGVQRVLALSIHFPHVVLSDEVTLDPPFDSSSSFLMEENHQKTVCDHFLPPEIMLCGKKIPPFLLKPLLTGDSSIQIDQPSSRIRVLALWRSEAGKPELWNQSRALLQELDIAARMFKNDKEIEILAVNFDSFKRSNASIISDYSDAGFSFPLYRVNPEEFADTPFTEVKKPALIFLDSQGTIQKFYSLPVSYVTLQFQLVLLRDGKNVSQNEEDSFEKAKINFKNLLQAAEDNDIYFIETDAPGIEIKIADAAEPKRFRLTQAWQNEMLDPGNPLVIDEDDKNTEETSDPLGTLVPSESVIIPYAGNMIAVISAQGKIIFRKATEAREPISVIRTLKTSDGKRYLAASSFRDTHKIHLFNDRFESPGVLDVQSRRQWIADFLLTDEDADKRPEIIMALLGDPVSNLIPVHGIYAIDIGEDGNCPLKWKDEFVINPYQIDFAHHIDEEGNANKLLLAMNSPIDNMGKIVVDDLEGGRRLHLISPPENISVQWIATSFRQEAPQTEMLAALLKRTGSADVTFAVLNQDGTPIQENPLPGATWDNHMERIVFCGAKEGAPFEWIVPTREGRIYFFDKKGKFFDQMAVGSELTGVRLARWKSGDYLIIATPTCVTAYQIH